MENVQEQRPWFFNLNQDGDEAVVRILHSKPETIEEMDIHTIKVGDKKKRLKCNGEDCEMCNDGSDINHRIFIHLYDYTDNREKVWDRTDKIIPQLQSLFESWNPLNSAVVKIKRIGNEFPKYDITPVNPNQYQDVDAALVDKKLAFRYVMRRDNNDISAFLKTGEFPERKPYVPKEEYMKQKEAEKASNEPVEENDGPFDISTPKQENRVDADNTVVDTFDPFADSIITKPKRV